MPIKQELNVAMIGYGFMGKAHSNAFLCANKFFELPVRFNRKVICGRTEETVRAMKEKWEWEDPFFVSRCEIPHQNYIEKLIKNKISERFSLGKYLLTNEWDWCDEDH